MALIICPECNKEISDKAASCPNCGFPIQNASKPRSSKTGFNICPKCGWLYFRANKCSKCNTEMIDCHTSSEEWSTASNFEQWRLEQKLFNKYGINSPEFNKTLFDETFQEEKAKYEIHTSPKVTCPYCNSTDTKKISSLAKATNIAMFGIFGNKRKYQWHCNHCGSDF